MVRQGSLKQLALPRKCVVTLQEHRVRQAEDRLAAGPLWRDHGLVFASAVGTPMGDHNVRRMFRVITEEAGPGTGMGAAGDAAYVRVAGVGSRCSGGGDRTAGRAQPDGHDGLVYRHQIVPALTRGAEIMDQIFG